MANIRSPTLNPHADSNVYKWGVVLLVMGLLVIGILVIGRTLVLFIFDSIYTMLEVCPEALLLSVI